MPGFEEAYLTDRGGVPHLALGRFAGPGDDAARAALARVKSASPFGMAVLLPLTPQTGSRAMARDELDLRGVADRLGEDALYTLQVAVYGYGPSQPGTPTAEELASFRAAAEAAAERYRAEGEEAYVLHGPINSVVTLGVFGEADLDDSVNPPLLSRRLRELQSRHPHTLLNGRGVMMRGRSANGAVVEQLQTSLLVEIPR